KPKRDRMTLLGFTHDDLVEALELNNRNDGAGRIDQGEEAILVRVTGAVQDVADLGRIQIRNAEGVLLPLSEVAEVRLGELERYGSVTADGKDEVVQGLVIGLRGANASAVVE